MKERSPLCRHCVQERHVCLHTGSQGVLFRAPEPAQDPSSQADDVLRWVGPAGWGGGGHSPFSGPRTQVLPVCLLEKYECARDGPNQP